MKVSEAMSGTVSFREDIGVVNVVSSNKVTIGELQASMDAVELINKTHGITRVLIDAREMTDGPSTFEMFDLINGLSKSEQFRTIKFAVITTQDEDGILHFGETVAQNRAIAFQLFDEREAAMKWLQE